MTPLDRLAAGRITFWPQWSARVAICRHVRGPGIGPRFRRGSNSWRDNFVECLFNPDLAMSPCPNCGAPGEDLTARGTCAEYCPACKTEIVRGDYDWASLVDCLRYRADLDAGLVETDEDIRCSGCRRPLGLAYEEWHANAGQIDCERAHCPLRAPAPEPAATQIAMSPTLPASPARERRPEPSYRFSETSFRRLPTDHNPLARVMASLERSLREAQERAGAAEGETPHDARRRNFDAAETDARRRDRAREATRG